MEFVLTSGGKEKASRLTIKATLPWVTTFVRDCTWRNAKLPYLILSSIHTRDVDSWSTP